MKLLASSLVRALAYCFHPRVMVMSIIPVVVLVLGVWFLAWLWWDVATQATMEWVAQHPGVSQLITWVESWGFVRFRAVLAPMVVLLVFIPVMVVLALLTVAVCMVPAIVRLVASRRFPDLEKLHGGPTWKGLLWAAGNTLVAMLMLVVTLPLWLVPPLAMICPALIWGWLAYRIMAFDVLAEHASVEERRAVMMQHRWPLYAMGVVTGMIGAVPALFWVTGAMWVAMAPVVLPLAMWCYTLTFAFSGLWFAHYLLEALQEWRIRPAWRQET
jgi:hypothetical protein